MHCIAAKFVAQLLTNDQKEQCLNVCLELREKANEDPTFTSIFRIIMGDKSWIYDPETAVEEPTITKSKKGMAGPEFNKTCSLFFSM
jgi:hypothetical protein